MTLLDAYALVAFLLRGPAAPQVRSLLREGDAAATTANLAEAIDVSVRVRGLPLERARETLEPLLGETIALVPLDRAAAERAAALRVRHYHRARCPISLADAVLLASAGPADRIATADPDVLAVAAAEGIDRVRLPAPG